MNANRDILSAWLLVAVLGAALVLGWGAAGPRATDTAAVCPDGGAPIAADLPRADAWQPDAALAGLADERTTTTSYEVAEARNLARIGATVPAELRLAYGSSTSLKPIRMC